MKQDKIVAIAAWAFTVLLFAMFALTAFGLPKIAFCIAVLLCCVGIALLLYCLYELTKDAFK